MLSLKQQSGNNFGSVHLLFCSLTILLLISSFGTWGVCRACRKLVELQFRLDRCVGERAQDFRNQLNFVESSNQKITGLRMLISVAQGEPWLIPPLQAAVGMLVASQERALLRWKGVCIGWLAHTACLNRNDRVTPLPGLDFYRPPPDQLGLQPLKWRGEQMPRSFQFKVLHRPRESRATVRKDDEIVPLQTLQKWKAFWGFI